MADSEQIKPKFFSLRLHPRNLFLPATLGLVLLLKWQLDMPWWGLALFLLVLPLYYFAVPLFVKKGVRDLERETLRLLQQGKRSELLRAYRRRWLLRLLAPPDRLQRQLAFMYAEVGDFGRACACYERAARSAAPGERLSVLIGLARARYRAGDYEGAEVIYRELLRRGQQMPEVLGGLAHSLLLQERDLGEAFRLVKRALKEAPTGPAAVPLVLGLAEALLLRSKPGKAAAELDELDEPRGDPFLEARFAWVRALLAVSEGDDEAARELFDEVVTLDPKGGLGDLARERIAELDEEEPEEEEPRVAG